MWPIFLICGVVFLVIGINFLIVGRSSQIKERIGDYVTPQLETSANDAGTIFGSARRTYNSFAGAIYSEETFRRLASANWPLTVAEYLLIRVVSVIGIFAILYWGFGQLVLGAILAFLVNYGFDFFINRAITQRKEKFKNQLVDLLVLISSSIRAGLSLPQAIDVVATEMTPPASEEFSRVKREVEIGLTLSQALVNLSKRMRDEDLDIVVTALNINIRAGGNLSKIIDRIVETIRDRIRLLFETRALTSYARYTGLLLTFLPVAVVGIIFLLSRHFFDPMLPPNASPIFVIIPIVSVLLGNFWLGRISKTKT